MVLGSDNKIDHKIIRTYRGMIYDRNGEILAMSLPKKTHFFVFKYFNTIFE